VVTLLCRDARRGVATKSSEEAFKHRAAIDSKRITVAMHDGRVIRVVNVALA